ncbi:sensor histidine kinase [Clostridium tagluense]|uniref:sensor histidine kinase n=2 Tax=Clostridium TaxID=1485 RepID=UPI00192E1310|nr:HAMP domain-containing sensor histidine kinase [Clostridium tagluense]MBW9159674.1 HAMP domain-containing histidine kinase [Clostridium tagluense]WLC66503.1 HAMP domain-containing histidine kinase [Clostridium tagluense]
MRDLKKNSMNKIYSIYILIFVSISILFFLYLFRSCNRILKINPNLVYDLNNFRISIIAFLFIFLVIAISFVWLTSIKVVKFYNNLCEVIDNVIAKKENTTFDTDKETLLSKFENKIKQLVDMVESERAEFNSDRNKLKSIISDISHQVKTPLANITIINETLIERELTKAQEKEFLKNMKFQIGKLQWLIEALIKMSRLETGIIVLNKEKLPLSETIAQVVGSVYLKAQKKNIHIEIKCDEAIMLCHDKKWTTEAIFNIVENAIKYTEYGGNINIEVVPLEIFTEIDISDDGIGILEEEINNIFKRFHRGREVQQIEGVGIGLYLTREIISKQGGYLKVKSEKDIGSKFSVFLQN